MTAAARFARLRAGSSPFVYKSAVAATAAAIGVLYVRQQQNLLLEAVKDEDPILRAPSLKWTPPTRAEMLNALKKGEMLSKEYEPSKELSMARNIEMPNVGDKQEGYDLLVSVATFKQT